MASQQVKYMQHKLMSNVLAYLTGAILIMLSSLTIADDYLDSLNDEATNLEYLDETRPSNAISTQQKSLSPEITRAIKSINHFERYFRKHDSASAAIYFRLSTQQRLRVFHRFKTTHNLNVVRKMTIEIFNQKR